MPARLFWSTASPGFSQSPFPVPWHFWASSAPRPPQAPKLSLCQSSGRNLTPLLTHCPCGSCCCCPPASWCLLLSCPDVPILHGEPGSEALFSRLPWGPFPHPPLQNPREPWERASAPRAHQQLLSSLMLPNCTSERAAVQERAVGRIGMLSHLLANYSSLEARRQAPSSQAVSPSLHTRAACSSPRTGLLPPS